MRRPISLLVLFVVFHSVAQAFSGDDEQIKCAREAVSAWQAHRGKQPVHDDSLASAKEEEPYEPWWYKPYPEFKEVGSSSYSPFESPSLSPWGPYGFFAGLCSWCAYDQTIPLYDRLGYYLLDKRWAASRGPIGIGLSVALIGTFLGYLVYKYRSKYPAPVDFQAKKLLDQINIILSCKGE
jgi:hypothetical protein